MTGEGVLWVIAEVGVGIAGFTGLIAAFGFKTSKWSDMDIFQFTTLAAASLCAVMFAVLPFIPYYYGMPEPTLWRFGSAIIIGVHIVAVLAQTGRLRRARQSRIRPADKVLGTTVAVGLVVAITANVLNILSDEPTISAYLVSLLFLLYISVATFGRLIYVIATSKG